jgi:hypothetical protein
VGRGFTEFELTSSKRREFVAFSAYLNYRLPNGSALHIEQQEAWCPICNRFVVAERIPTIEELEQALIELSLGDAQRLKLLALSGRPIAEEATELVRRLEWRRTRLSPARCLECGSPAIRPLPPDDEFSHPATGEKSRLSLTVLQTWNGGKQSFRPREKGGLIKGLHLIAPREISAPSLTCRRTRCL